MTIRQITDLQKEAGVYEMQKLILSGAVWKLEGSMGRVAMDGLKEGVYYLPDEPHNDYYGNRVPAREDLRPGTKGTLENAWKYWEKYLTEA
jgi:hypothetical protein